MRQTLQKLVKSVMQTQRHFLCNISNKSFQPIWSTTVLANAEDIFPEIKITGMRHAIPPLAIMLVS